jgi:hypothetical protein
MLCIVCLIFTEQRVVYFSGRSKKVVMFGTDGLWLVNVILA